MINILRKNQKALWIVIALLCIPFVFYFSNQNIGPMGSNEFGKIYGRPISIVEFQRHARLFMLARGSRHADLSPGNGLRSHHGK